MRSTILFFLSILAMSPLFGQWDPISPEDFTTDGSQAFPAQSVYLFQKAKYEASESGILGTVYYRAHILDEKGVEALSKFRIQHYKKDVIVKGIKGRSLNLNQGEIEISKLSNEDVFTEKPGPYFKEKKIILPKVKVGSIVEFRYTFFDKNSFSIAWFFQENFPVLKSEVSFLSDGSSSYQPILQVQDLSRVKSHVNGMMASLSMENIPGLSKEVFVDNLSDYRAKVRFQLVGVRFGDAGVSVLKDWDELTERMLQTDLIGTLNKDSKKLHKIALQELPEFESPVQQMLGIFNFVHEKISWDETYNFFRKNGRSVVDIFNSGEGNSGEINLVLTSLLKSSGLETYPALISTRDHGGAIKIHPVFDQFNHLLSLVKIDGKEYLLDASQKYPFTQLPPSNLLGQEAWVLDPDNPKWYPVVPKNLSQIILIAQLRLSSDGDVNGEITEIHQGYTVSSILENYEDDKKEFWDVYLDKTIEISEQELIRKKDVEKGMSLKYKLNSSIWANSLGDFLEFDLFKLWRLEKNPFSETKRQFPINLRYPYLSREVFTIEAPEGYVFESFPQNISVSLPNRDISVKFNSMLLNQGKTLKIENMMKVQRVNYPKEDADMLRQIFEKKLQKENEIIVLKKQ
ncbi:MAG: DUF3857 domain-containing protein [Bacteroidia bacterium]|nr:DUF3857 domain-containing protein [Bacteroidia bacterium]